MRKRRDWAKRQRLTLRRRVNLTLLALVVWLLLACVCVAPTGFQVTTTDMARQRPAWACPSDTPLPWGEEGAKRSPGCCCEEDCDTDPVTGEEDCDCVDDTCYECRYYQWEQENGALGGPPFPAPTEYTITNDTQFRLGHLVNFGGGVDVQVSAAPGGLYAFNEESSGWEAATEPTSTTQMLQLVTIDFDSQATQDMSFDPARQVVISGITKADGRQLAGRWTWDSHASDASGIGAGEEFTASRDLRHTTIPSGTSQIVVPIFTPPGNVEIVDVQLDPPGAAQQPGAAGDFRVQFIDDPDPYCSHSGIPHWSPGGRDQVVGIAAPPGSSEVVQTAMQAVGHQYCWGGNGYEACSGGGQTPPCYGSDLPCWDCSGLTTWVYKQHGITLPRHSSGQRNLPAVSIAEIQPGDLLTFPGHVGLFAGDLDGDGTGDMIHAGMPDLYGPGAGIGVEKNVLQPGGHWRNLLSAVTRPSR